jgi:hypothetical protein
MLSQNNPNLKINPDVIDLGGITLTSTGNGKKITDKLSRSKPWGEKKLVETDPVVMAFRAQPSVIAPYNEAVKGVGSDKTQAEGKEFGRVRTMDGGVVPVNKEHIDEKLDEIRKQSSFYKANIQGKKNQAAVEKFEKEVADIRASKPPVP